MPVLPFVFFLIFRIIFLLVRQIFNDLKLVIVVEDLR